MNTPATHFWGMPATHFWGLSQQPVTTLTSPVVLAILLVLAVTLGALLFRVRKTRASRQ